MTYLRRSAARGAVNIDWLDTRHTFSFGSYYDPAHMGFSALRVINEDVIAPMGGFPTHGHQDMEIVTVVLRGALEHKDSMGNGSVIRRGDVQRMSAGTGVRHSEFNHSDSEPVHLLQIWILPEAPGITPGYEQANIDDAQRQGVLRTLASRDGRDESVTIHQDASIYGSVLEDGDMLEHDAEGRSIWVQVTAGSLTVNETELAEGDGLGLVDVSQISLAASGHAEFLLFDLPGSAS